MKVVWAEPADEDRQKIIFFIAQDNPKAAVELDALFTDAANSLSTLPLRGRPGRLPDTRELVVHKNYIVVYAYDVSSDIVYITAALHASRLWPPE